MTTFQYSLSYPWLRFSLRIQVFFNVFQKSIYKFLHKNHINHLLDIFPLVHYGFIAIINTGSLSLAILKTLKSGVY